MHRSMHRSSFVLQKLAVRERLRQFYIEQGNWKWFLNVFYANLVSSLEIIINKILPQMESIFKLLFIFKYAIL